MHFLKKYSDHNNFYNDRANTPNINVDLCKSEKHVHYITDNFDAIVEYLSCTTTIGATTNNQCFDTGVYADDTIGIYCKASINNASSDTYIFGNYYVSPNRRYCFGRDSNGWYYGWGDFLPKSSSDRYQNSPVFLKLNWLGDHKWYSGNNISSYKGGTLGTLGFTQPATIKFLNNCKIYFFKVSKGNEIIHDFIPVRKNGVGYFYDKITNKLYANRNLSATVIYGPDVYDYEVEYLEGTGNQYINTNVSTLNSFVGIDTYITFPTHTYNKWGAGYNNYSSGDRSGFQIGMWTSSSVNYIYAQFFNSDRSIIYSIGMNYNASEHHIIINCKNIGIAIDDHIYQSNQCNNMGEYGGNVLLFRRGGNYSYATSCRFGKTKIYLNNNQLELDFIPVSKNGIGYMYDTITNSLFGNAGSGNFVLGNIVNKPYDKEIEYLTSNNQPYIDTGIKASNNTVIYCKFTVGSGGGFLFGGRTANENKEYTFLFGGGTQESSYRFGNKTSPRQTMLSTNTLYEIYSTTANKNVVTVKNLSTDDTITYTATSNTFICDYTCHIFGANNANNHVGAITTIYAFKLYDDTTLLMDLIPVRKNGIGYMYDKVSKRLFGNAGSGSFVLGPDK